MSGEHAEIIRLRERTHRILSDLAALTLRVEVVELRVEAVEQFRRVYQRKVDALIRDKEIRDAIQERAKLELTWLQRAGALVLFCLTTADMALRIF